MLVRHQSNRLKNTILNNSFIKANEVLFNRLHTRAILTLMLTALTTAIKQSFWPGIYQVPAMICVQRMSFASMHCSILSISIPKDSVLLLTRQGVVKPERRSPRRGWLDSITVAVWYVVRSFGIESCRLKYEGSIGNRTS